MKDMDKVIFRSYFDPFVTGTAYLAVFPNDEANVGHYGAVAFHFDRDGRAVFEPYGEISHEYYYKKTAVIHRSSAIVPRLLDAVQERYDMPFRVMDKIMRN